MLNPALILLNLFKKPLAADTRLMPRPRSLRPVPAPPPPPPPRQATELFMSRRQHLSRHSITPIQKTATGIH